MSKHYVQGLVLSVLCTLSLLILTMTICFLFLSILHEEKPRLRTHNQQTVQSEDQKLVLTP